ncbi:MAG: rod shape-determining protein MreD [wastewater metagenome]|nr:rod shape-determining protein MreD [Candidatus Loosdrechtia aerotolerans]
MRWFTFFCIILCISLFQSTMMHWIAIGSAVPDLYFPLVIYYSFITDMKRNAIINWIIGLSKDLFSEGSLGINSIFFVAIGILIWSIRGVVFRGHIITQILVTFIFSILYNMLYATYIAISFHSLHLLPTVWKILICSLYTAMIVPALFWVLNTFQPTHKFSLTRDK